MEKGQVSQLVDVVSLLLKNEDETSILLTVEENNEVNLPWEKVVDGNWKDTAIRFLTSLNIDALLTTVRLYKFWIPYHTTSFIFHVIYEVIVPRTARNKSKISALEYSKTLKWISKRDIQKHKIKNKELCHAMGILSDLNTIVGSPSDADLFQKFVNVSDFVVEILEPDIIFDQDNISNAKHDNIYNNLLEFSNYTLDDQHMLYNEFLTNCFPNFYMNIATFTRFIANFSDVIDGAILFRAADIHNRGLLSFRDFLYIVIACDSSTQHCGSIAEIRSKYIFNYFAMEKRFNLQPNEFANMIKAIHAAKASTADAKAIAEEIELAVLSLGLKPGKPMDLVNFLTGVRELKIRGTSMILRFSKSVRNHLRVRFQNNKQEQQNSPSTIQNPIKSTYEICTHAVNFKRKVPLFDITDLVMQNSWMSLNTVEPVINLVNNNPQSDEAFGEGSVSGIILQNLQYFTDYIPPSAENDSKNAYSWGSMNLMEFGNNLIDVCNAVLGILEKESRMLDLHEPVYLFGDIHGSFSDIRRFEKSLWNYGMSLCPSTILILGDYVDRGSHSVEVVAYLFANKVQCIDKVYLLRGNHEIRSIQKMFTFQTECLQKFGELMGKAVWDKINAVFDAMPLAATINNKIFCCHGGVPPPWLCPAALEINKIPVKIDLPEEQNQLAWNLMWNDPVEKDTKNADIKLELAKKNGFALNTRRGTGHYFSELGLTNFLKLNDFSHVIRAHEFRPSGVYFQFGGKLITVFSSSNYCGMRNSAACVLVAAGKIRAILLEN